MLVSGGDMVVSTLGVTLDGVRRHRRPRVLVLWSLSLTNATQNKQG